MAYPQVFRFHRVQFVDPLHSVISPDASVRLYVYVTGILVYVGVVEMLVRGISADISSSKHMSAWKILLVYIALFAGAGLMSLIGVWA